MSVADTTDPVDPAYCQPLWHPLELIAYFRRFPQSHLRNVVFTLIWNVGFTLFFVMLGVVFDPRAPLGRMLLVDFVIASCIGYVIHLGYLIGERLLGPRVRCASFGMRAAYYAGIPVLGVFGGYAIALTLLEWRHARAWVFSWQGISTILLVSLVVSTVLAAIMYARERQARSEAAYHAERARIEATEHQFHIAKLKLLEAQIEPHFLYNTLANVISLIDSSPASAKHLVERLIDYLRSAALRTSDQEVTLGRQIDLVRAYLELIAVRMGSRLRFEIDVPSGLADLALPPMLLQPLVENAIKHGIDPRLDGGKVIIAARREGDELVLSVADDGVGVAMSRSTESTRLGLANLRDRLQSLYHGRARLLLQDRVPGTLATITLPVSATA